MTPRTKSRFGATLWQMTLLGLRYLNGRRLRTTLTTLALVFGVALIFAINLVLPSALEAFKQGMSPITGADINITSITGEAFEPGAVLPKIATLQDVRAVSGALRRQFAVPGASGSDVGKTGQLTVIGVDPAQSVRQFVVSEGRFLQPGDTGSAVVPAGLAELAPELKIGTSFPLVTAAGLRQYTVVGFLAERGNPSAPEIYVSLPEAQAVFNQAGLVNSVEVALTAGADQESVAASIRQALGAGFELNAQNDSTGPLAAMEVGFAIFDLFGVLALFLGAFLIFNTFRTVVIERRRDIAMLRAVGATRRQITQLILIESLIQGLIGSLIGLLVGYIMAVLMISFMGELWSSYINRGTLELQLSAPAALGALALGLLTSLIAGYWPARSAGKTSPLEALRPATTESIRRATRWGLLVGAAMMLLAVLLLATGSNGAIGGALLFMVGLVLAAPSLVLPMARLFSPLLSLWFAREGDLARGNMVRQPGRAAITASTLMIGLATFILMAALVLSFGDLIRNLARTNFSSDIMLLPQSVSIYDNVVGADPALAERIQALPEVAEVGSQRYAAATANGQELQVLGIDPARYPKVASFEFSGGEAGQIFGELGSGRNAIVTSIALTTLKLSVGSEIVLQTPSGPQTYRVAGVGNDLLSFKIAAIFISQENLAADFHKAEDVLLMITLKPDADRAAALANVQQIAADYPQFTTKLTSEYSDQLLQTTEAAFMLFYLVALLILIPAALGLLNTLTINILERTREIGVVRAVGGSRRQVRRMVTAEALLLGIFGVSMGIAAGVAMSYGFIMAFGLIGWQMPYTFPLGGIIAALIIGVMLALFASILPARSAAKLDIIRALQYE